MIGAAGTVQGSFRTILSVGLPSRMPGRSSVNGDLFSNSFGQVGAGKPEGKLIVPDGPQCEPHLTRRCS